MDFLGGGELFLHLRKKGLILEKVCFFGDSPNVWQEACFYVAEMILAIEFLHSLV